MEVVFCPPPLPVDAEAVTKNLLDARIRGLKEILDEPFLSVLHKNAKTVLEMYESGTLSPTEHKTIYVQDGVVYDSPPTFNGLPIWTEVNHIYVNMT
jgi:hypothetical protein